MRDDLVAGTALRGLADVAVAERGAGQHVDAAGLRPPGLAAPVPLHQLGLLVLGEHALELDQQLVFGAVAARPLHELDPGPAAGEFLDQQRLVGELAGQPVRRVNQDHVQAALGGQVPQRLQRGPDQRRPEVTLVGEDPLLRDVKPALAGVLAQGGQLGADRLVLGAGRWRSSRRSSRSSWSPPPPPGRWSWPAAAAPRCRRPLTFRRRHRGTRRAPSPPAALSPGRTVPVSTAEELLQRLSRNRRDRAPGLPGVLPYRGGQPHRKPDGEHCSLARDLDPARLRSPGDITPGLPLRAAQPPASTRAASADGTPASSRPAAALTCDAYSAAPARRSPGMT